MWIFESTLSADVGANTGPNTGPNIGPNTVRTSVRTSPEWMGRDRPINGIREPVPREPSQ